MHHHKTPSGFYHALTALLPIAGLMLPCLLTPAMSFAELVDTKGNIATNETILGIIDMGVSTVGDLSHYVTTGAVAQAELNTAAATNAVAQDLKQWTTNSTIVGYTDWSYTGTVIPSHEYSINMSESGGNYDFTLYDTTSASLIGTVTTNLLNPTVLVYPYNEGAITASRQEIRRNTNGFAMYTDVTAVEEKIDEMDTSYYRFNGITNKNQSVQYVYADTNTTDLHIAMPESGMTKDWLVYVLAETNLTVHLPPATYWGSSEAVTNAIPAYTPTALYFTQITDNTFSIGRKEFVPITVESAREKALNKARKRAARYPTNFSRNAANFRRPLPPAPQTLQKAPQKAPAK